MTVIIKVRWSVRELINVMTMFDVQKVYRSPDGTSNWTEITTAPTRVPLVVGTTSYYFDDLVGDTSLYYAVAYFNSVSGFESALSPPIPGTSSVVTPVFDSETLQIRAGEIRAFLRDWPNYNILLDDIEFADEDISRAMRLAVAKYNAITPVTTITAESMNEWLLLAGVCCILFRSEGARQLRNQVQAQDGNIAPVGIDAKEALYARWADQMCLEFDTLSQKIKTQNNMESVYGSLSSGYRYVGRYITGSRRND